MMSPRQVVEKYWKIESKRDVDAILACYNHQAQLLVPGLGRLIGHSQIRLFYQQSVELFPGLDVKIVGALEAGDRGAFEWQAVFKDHAGQSFTLKGVNVIRVHDGRLQEVHVYYDPSEIAAPGAET